MKFKGLEFTPDIIGRIQDYIDDPEMVCEEFWQLRSDYTKTPSFEEMMLILLTTEQNNG